MADKMTRTHVELLSNWIYSTVQTMVERAGQQEVWPKPHEPGDIRTESLRKVFLILVLLIQHTQCRQLKDKQFPIIQKDLYVRLRTAADRIQRNTLFQMPLV